MFNIGTAMQSLDIGRKLEAYTGVIIHAGQDDNGNAIDITSGNNSGYVLEFDNPIGTQQMADAILANLKLRGVRYQPFEAGTAEIDPACEIGDGVIVNGTESVIMSIDSDHSQKMSSTIAAPMDEEVDHEFQYEPRTTREFKRETAYARSRISQNANEISLEVARATKSEGELVGRITVQADRITSEVTRATTAEGTLSSRISMTADAITSEVTRATAAEGSLGTRIDQRLDSITLSVTSASGSSTFAIKDGSTTLDTKTLNLTVTAANISGKLTVGQLADGSVVTSSKTETEYYLSTSASSATGGSWATTVPTWASGKYIWTRQKTTDTKNDNTTSTTYSPSSSGAYDKNLTTALSTASSAASAASGAQTSADSAASSASTANTNALSATKRTSVIYHSMSGGTAPTAPTAWVSNVTGNQNVWTLVRPEYSSSYPALYIAQQSETVGGTYSCSTPKIDATTTVIDGAHIITGTIDADKISVTNLQSISASLAGWTVSNALIRKTTDNYDMYFQCPTNPADDSHAINVRKKVDGSFVSQFLVRWDGSLTANNATIKGKVTATSGTIGGVTIENGVLSGINDTNIQTGGISGGSGGSIGSGTITTDNTTSGINTSLGYANFANGVFNNTNTANYISASTGYITYLHATNTLWIGSARCYLGSVEIDGVNYNVVRYYT